MWVNIIIDLIIVALIILGAIFGIKRGFFLAVTKPVKWLAALLLAFALSNVVADAIIQPLIEDPITNQITELLSEKCSDITAETARDKLPTLLKLAAGLVDVDINSMDAASSHELIAQIVDKLAIPVIHLISVILSFVAVYFVSKIVLAILLVILNKFFDRGLFGVLNKVLGCIFGVAFSFVIVWLVVIIFGYVISLPSIAATEWASNFSGGFIYRFFKSFTPLDLLLSF